MRTEHSSFYKCIYTLYTVKYGIITGRARRGESVRLVLRESARPRVPAGLSHSLLLLLTELEHGCDCVEHVSLAARVIAHQVAQDDVLQVLQVGSFPGLASLQPGGSANRKKTIKLIGY